MGEDSKMNNETCLDCGKRVTADSIHTCSPQLKKLTDEEINELYMEHGNKDWDWQIDFGRAILRKAQEK